MARSNDYSGETGIGVSDLKKSAKFYEQALGMKQAMTFKLDYMAEIVLTHEGRNAVVLMHWTDGSARNYKDVPVKLVFYVSDPKAVADRIREFGCEFTREPAPRETMNCALAGLAKDPDGYVVDLLQSPAAAQAPASA